MTRSTRKFVLVLIALWASLAINFATVPAPDAGSRFTHSHSIVQPALPSGEALAVNWNSSPGK